MRAMSYRLPTHIDPLRLVAQRGRLKGNVPLAGMERLASSVESCEGEADVELEFGIDEAGFKVMTGQISAQLKMLCQRCMGVMDVPVMAEVRVGIVADSTKVQELSPELDPMITDGKEPVSLVELVEDELILSLPIVPMHGQGEGCVDLEKFRAKDEAGEKPNPFAALAVLKEKH